MHVQPDMRAKTGQDAAMDSRADQYPDRIVCLTEETTETLYLFEEDWRIMGISGFTVRPPRARREKPRVSAFTSAKLDLILQLQPDLVLGFSDLQADIAAQLIRTGIAVHVFNQRSVAEIFGMIRVLGGIIGCSQKADQLCTRLAATIERVRESAASLPRRPRVYFEEWDAPLISGIRWVSELIGIAGGIDCFADHAHHSLARNRIIADADEVVHRAPDIIIASWCGKKVRPETIARRTGWDRIPAVASGEIHEIKSPLILQPGPAALTDGLDALHAIIRNWASNA
jgi:iron complex transport system substrate-binding protein